MKRKPCTYGLETEDCTRADVILDTLAESPLSCDSCRVDETASRFLDNWSDMSDEDKGLAAQWFARMGMGEVVSLIKKKLPTRNGSGFVCPVLDAEVVTPCRLKKCKYNVDYSWSNNCILQYMYEQESQALSLEEISFLYRVPYDKVCDVYRDALAEMRTEAISVESEYDDRLQKSFNFFPTRSVCCVCESRIDGSIQHALLIKSVGKAYCSKECKAEKPARLVELEIQYGLDIEQILKWVFGNFKNLGLAEQALGIPRWLAYYASKQFLGCELQDYFGSLRRIKETRKAKLVRRTWHKSTWVDNILQDLEPTRQLIYRKYGNPVIRVQPILDDVDKLLNER